VVVAKREEPGGDRDNEQVHLVTSARKPHSEEISERARRYLISMAFRTACVVLAIFVLDGWLRIVAIVGGVVLPWFAVVMANAGPVADDDEPEFVRLGRTEIEGGPAALGGQPDAAADGAANGGANGAAHEAPPTHAPGASERIGRQRRPSAS
jgi:hypothetical protein